MYTYIFFNFVIPFTRITTKNKRFYYVYVKEWKNHGKKKKIRIGVLKHLVAIIMRLCRGLTLSDCLFTFFNQFRPKYVKYFNYHLFFAIVFTIKVGTKK